MHLSSRSCVGVELYRHLRFISSTTRISVTPSGIPDQVEPPLQEPLARTMLRRGYSAARGLIAVVALTATILGITISGLISSGINWVAVSTGAAALIVIWLGRAWFESERARHAVTETFTGYYERIRARTGYVDRGPRSYGIDAGFQNPFLGGSGGQGGDGGVVGGNGSADGGNGGHGAWPGGAGGGGGSGGHVGGDGNANGGDGGNGAVSGHPQGRMLDDGLPFANHTDAILAAVNTVNRDRHSA